MDVAHLFLYFVERGTALWTNITSSSTGFGSLNLEAPASHIVTPKADLNTTHHTYNVTLNKNVTMHDLVLF